MANSFLSLILAIAAALGLRYLDQSQHPPIKALLNHPGNAYRWADLGDTYSSNPSELSKARTCFQRALALSGGVPQIWLRDANFHFSLDEPSAALQSAARVLRTVPDYDGVLFNYTDRMIDNPATVLAAIGTDRRITRSYLDHFIAANDPASASTVWHHLASHGFTDDRLASSYIDLLLRNKRYEAAVADWASHLGPRRGPYPTTNLLFNSGFETEPTGASLDWRIQPSPGFQTARDNRVIHSGQWSLRISFLGNGNVSYNHVIQQVPLRPGTYLLRAWIRTDDLTTNEGLRLAIDSQLTDPLVGTHSWTPIDQSITVFEPRLVSIRLVRNPSAKFDNKISGTAWIDSLSLTRQ